MKILKKFILCLALCLIMSCLIISTPHKAMGADPFKDEHDNRARLNAVPREHRMYVIGKTHRSSEESIHLINTENHTYTGKVSHDFNAFNAEYNPVNGCLYVHGEDVETIIDPDHTALRLNVSSDRCRFYHPKHQCMCLVWSNGMTMIHADHTTIKTFLFNKNTETEEESRPINIAYNSFNQCLYVINWYNDRVFVVSPENTLLTSIDVEKHPMHAAYNPHNHCVYIANLESHTISVIDENHILQKNIPVEKEPVYIFYHPSNHSMYVMNWLSHSVSIINETNNVINTLNVGRYPIHAVYNSYNHCVYVAHNSDEHISIIDQNHTVKNVNIGYIFASRTHYNPYNHCVYIIGYNVAVINANHELIKMIDYELNIHDIFQIIDDQTIENAEDRTNKDLSQ